MTEEVKIYKKRTSQIESVLKETESEIKNLNEENADLLAQTEEFEPMKKRMVELEREALKLRDFKRVTQNEYKRLEDSVKKEGKSHMKHAQQLEHSYKSKLRKLESQYRELEGSKEM